MQRLTLKEHGLLRDQGYRYLLLKDVRHTGQADLHYIVQPMTHIPARQHFSCTGIDDGMILDILHNPKLPIHLYYDTAKYPVTQP